jgi:hypothetical protein
MHRSIEKLLPIDPLSGVGGIRVALDLRHAVRGRFHSVARDGTMAACLLTARIPFHRVEQPA